ncbi:hypothetical protein [Tenacibaculum ovolyticum]|uniref:hypothetical protein n=1 Tax=Tenacibaculum ovolyticum TaxID=104270 RepID=UPI0004002770|nr:hypothetical protein [Tenacibaculum ovolyticum]
MATIKEVKTIIENSTIDLNEIVKRNCWNVLSDNYKYFLHEISNERGNVVKKKKLKLIKEVSEDLSKIYFDIYDLNFHIYASKKDETIIVIKYFLKKFLEEEFFEEVKNNKSMIHSKLNIPFYRKHQNQKFDVNWELGGLRYQWNSFFSKLLFKLRYINRETFIKE